MVGLPNVGKSTLFNAITNAGAQSANYPFCSIEPNVGMVSVPDERLEKLAEIYNPDKFTPAVIEFVDIAGLVKGASKGEGLGNKFLGNIREVDAILQEGDFDLRLGSSHLHVLHDAGWFKTVSRQDYARLMLENAAAAAQTGYFQVIPHIDMYRWVFVNSRRFPCKDSVFNEQALLPYVRQTLDAIKRNGVMLEINPHFACGSGSMDDVYPSRLIAACALASGVRFCYGSDAHRAEDVGAMLEQLEQNPLYGEALLRHSGEGTASIIQKTDGVSVF